MEDFGGGAIIVVVIVLILFAGRGFGGWGGGEGRHNDVERAEIDMLKVKLDESYLKQAELKAGIDKQEILNAIGKSECHTEHRLDKIECKMLKAPEVVGDARVYDTRPIYGPGPGAPRFDWAY